MSDNFNKPETKEEIEFRVEAKVIASEVAKREKAKLLILAMIIGCVIATAAE